MLNNKKATSESFQVFPLNGKKGVSAVVATVLIVMITVAAVAIIWATIIPMIKNSAEEGIKCHEAQTDLQILEGSYTCYNASNTNATVQIQRGTEAAVTKLEIYWSMAGTSRNQTQATVPGVNGVKVYTVNASNISGTGTDLGGSPERVSIAPIITVGNTETKCEPIQEVELVACA